MGGTDYDEGNSVAVAPDGSVYLAGSSGSYETGGSDAFLAKYDAAGNQLWSFTSGMSYPDDGSGVTVAADGTVYLVGQSQVLGSPDDAAFITRYDATGNQLWSRLFGGVTSYERANAVAVASDGAVYIAGDSRPLGASTSDASVTMVTGPRQDSPLVLLSGVVIIAAAGIVAIIKLRKNRTNEHTSQEKELPNDGHEKKM
jgi:outer membrane protein assembly factor BamB